MLNICPDVNSQGTLSYPHLHETDPLWITKLNAGMFVSMKNFTFVISILNFSQATWSRVVDQSVERSVTAEQPLRRADSLSTHITLESPFDRACM